MLVEGFLKKRKHVKSIHILTCSFQALRRSLCQCKSSNAKLLFSLGKTCAKSHETWNISKVVSTFSMAREKLSAWKDAWEASNPPKMLGVSAFGELHRDGRIKYLAISSASWRPLLKFSQVSFPKQFSVGVLNAFLVCPPCLGCCICLPACVSLVSPGFVSHLVPACLSLVSGLVSQLVSLVWDAVSAYRLVFLLSPPVLSPILSRLVFPLFLVLSSSLSPWSGMLYLPTRLCFSCLPRFCLPSCPGLSSSCFWSCLPACLPGLGCCICLPAPSCPGLSFSCFWSCLPACLPGLGCCICLPARVSLVSPGFVSHLVPACLSLVSGLVSQLVSLVWDAVSAYPLVFLLSPPVLSPILSWLVFPLFLVLSPSLSPWSGMLYLPTRLCFSCLPQFCLPSCPGLSVPAGLGCCVRLRLPGLCFSCLRFCLPSCPHPWACLSFSWSGMLWPPVQLVRDFVTASHGLLFSNCLGSTVVWCDFCIGLLLCSAEK